MAFPILEGGLPASGMAFPILERGFPTSGMAFPILEGGFPTSGMAFPIWETIKGNPVPGAALGAAFVTKPPEKFTQNVFPRLHDLSSCSTP
jgi:hypothetical protein